MKGNSKAIQVTLIISATIIILTLIGLYFYKSNFSTQNTISVNGNAVQKVSPDEITIYFNVDTKGKTSIEAENSNTEITQNLKKNVIELGFSEDDVTTENFNIYPEYDYSQGQKLIGYRASHSLKVALPIDKQNKIGEVIDAGAKAGAGISYINFELSPALEQQSKAEAIKIAASDAKVKAESMATGFGKKLGRLVSVTLDNFNYYPWRVYDTTTSTGMPSAESAKEAVSSITPSEREVTAYVTAVYRLG